jgi:hypothetical protein
MTNNANNQTNNYDDTGIFDDNNISQNRLCNSMYMHITPHNYLLCIPHIPYTSTKMDVARAVENHIITSGKGKSSEIENFQYVKNVTFVRAFDQVVFRNLTSARDLGSSSFGFGSGSKECYRDPWYKIALVNIEIQPHYSENRIPVYTNGENAFYTGVCTGDIVINSWPDAFFIAHPRTYFQPQLQTQELQQQQQQQHSKNEVDRKQGKDKEMQDSAFQKWMYEFKLRQLERKVKEHENTIRQYELDAIRTQNTVNEYAESIRYLTRQHFDSPDLHGLHSSNLQITSYISALNNRYARVCVSDTTFLEANRNMKLKQLNGFVIHACDECDACQELIYSIDHTYSEDRDEVFASIEKMICKINKSVQQFEKLHVNAERSLFGLRNRRVLEDFGAYLNTALEIMEEVTYRVSTFTQDLEYARCYGQLYRPQNAMTSASLTLGYNYDYVEDADPVNDEEYDDNSGIESTQQMLHYFDEHNQGLYKQQEQENEQKEQQISSTTTNTTTLNVSSSVYHEEAVIIEEEQGEQEQIVDVKQVNAKETTTTVTETATVKENSQEKKRNGWLSSWF